MRVFIGMLTALFVSATGFPTTAEELDVDSNDVICQGEIVLDTSINAVFVGLFCNQGSVTEEHAIGYARSALDSAGFTDYTGIKKVIPLGPEGPTEAETSPDWGFIFIIPVKV